MTVSLKRGSLLDAGFEKLGHCVRENQTRVSFDLAVCRRPLEGVINRCWSLCHNIASRIPKEQSAKYVITQARRCRDTALKTPRIKQTAFNVTTQPEGVVTYP